LGIHCRWWEQGVHSMYVEAITMCSQ
jgi:hypothetical protein